MNNFKVQLFINGKDNSQGAILGISYERFEVLQPIMAKAHEESDNPLEAISKMSEHAENANELCFMSCATQAFYERMYNPINMLKSMLGGTDD